MNDRLGIIIQARTNSSRLPGKVLLPVNKLPLILFLYKRLQENFDLPIVVATTDSSNDDSLVQLLEHSNIKYYRGSEENVLHRFLNAAQEFCFTHVIRICSDNPLLSISYLQQLINVWKTAVDDIDYLSFSVHSKPTILTHFGLFAEVVSVAALKKIEVYFPRESSYREHVTNGVYSNCGVFNVRLIELPNWLRELDNIRLTIDTREDYERVIFITEHCINTAIEDIIEFVQHNSSLRAAMYESIQKNRK